MFLVRKWHEKNPQVGEDSRTFAFINGFLPPLFLVLLAQTPETNKGGVDSLAGVLICPFLV